jgi:hypothetical protein
MKWQNCVKMNTDSDRIGQWANEPCNKKSVIVCHKTLTVTICFLYKKLLETSHKLTDSHKLLNETRETFSTHLKQEFREKWINFKLFTKTDGKQNTFFIWIYEKMLILLIHGMKQMIYAQNSTQI